MLVLSRKLGESIVLPDCEATITVISVDSNRVRLGITAPRGIPVHRTEVWTRVCGEKLQANATALPASSGAQ